MKIFTLSIFGDKYYFLDNLTMDERGKCEQLAADLRSLPGPHDLNEFIKTLYNKHGITLQRVAVSFCLGI